MFAGENELYVAYGTPAATQPLNRFIVKHILHEGVQSSPRRQNRYWVGSFFIGNSVTWHRCGTSLPVTVLAPQNTAVERRRTMASPRILGPHDGHRAVLGGTGARIMIEGNDAGKRFALVEHPLQPRALAAPMHRHHHEDEYSFVLEGIIGVLLGDSVVIGNPGDLIFKPREQWHTFWNATNAQARVLEIISPAGFENYFRELAVELIGGPPDPQRFAALCARYAIDMDMSSVPSLIQRFGIRFP